ncbi:MAG: serine/threonine-protein kinase [Pseudomonadota bacterium]
MRVIIINDSAEYRTRLRRLLAGAFPDVEVSEYDPEQSGQPDAGFNWDLYDLLMIEDQLANRESGLAWLAVLSLDAKLPPAVLLANAQDPFVASKVQEMPDTEYVLKDSLDEPALKKIIADLKISDVLVPKPETSGPTNFEFPQDREIVGNIIFEATGEHYAKNGGYKFVRLIGQGAHSRVYLAERVSDQLTMVLKVLDLTNIEDETISQRFAQEAELVASIDSPYVVKFFDHGFTSQFGYIAVEFFTRGDLKQRLELGVYPEDAIIYALNIAFGLEAIHGQGIVHRDLKPGNIMFRADDSLALADFGISKRLDGGMELTRTGSILGTLNYMSPEQGLGEEVDERTDLYGLGMILFELLTGEKAYRAGSPSALVYQHLYADVPRLPDALGKYQPLVDSLLAKDKKDRYQSASETVANLQTFC